MPVAKRQDFAPSVSPAAIASAPRVPASGDVVFAPIVNGKLEVRLADDPLEIEAAQALRYRVFYDELAASPSPEMLRDRRDFDGFDDVADHLLVLDRTLGRGPEAVVGTYRLIRRDAAARKGGFYTASEYDIRTLETYPGEILELGRSCVAAEYRNRPTMQLLWRGIAAYVFHFDIALMFGCASLPGNDIDTIAPQLSYLAQHHAAPSHVSVRALPSLYVDMNVLPADAIKPKEALMTLPPLIKGYLRLGGCVGDGAVIDRQFNTTDVCMIVQTDAVTDKYYKHYQREVREHVS